MPRLRIPLLLALLSLELVAMPVLAQRDLESGGSTALPAETPVACCLCTRGQSHLCATVTSETEPANCERFGSAEVSGLNCSGPVLHGAQCQMHETGGSDSAVCPIATQTLEAINEDQTINLSQEVTVAAPFHSITPELGVPIPGLVFSPATQEGDYTIIPFLAQYISAVYRYAVGLAIIAAIIMVVYGGFRYLLGAGLGDIKAGRQIILDAIIGLLVALSAYTLLNIVNPETLNLEAIKLKTVEPIDLDLEFALPHIGGGTGFEEGGPTMCVAYDQCPNMQLVRLRDVLAEIAQHDPDRARRYLLKIDGCTGNEMTVRARGNCVALSRKLNTTIKEQFLTLLERWPEASGKLQIGEIFRTVSTQFTGFMHLRPGCGSLLSGFPAPRTTCPTNGHGNGTGMDIKFVPTNSGGHTNNCADVEPGIPFPKFMTDLGWVHLCHEQWHFELASTHPGARTEDTWNNIPCFDSAATRDSYLSCEPRPIPPTPSP